MHAFTYIVGTTEQEKLARILTIAHGGPTCNHATRDDGKTDGRYTCTRELGHTGLHAAHWASHCVCAVWDGLRINGRDK